MSGRYTIASAMIIAALAGLPPACTPDRGKPGLPAAKSRAAATGKASAGLVTSRTYDLVSVDGRPVPYAPADEERQGPAIVSSGLALNGDGTFVMDIGFGKMPNWLSNMTFKGTYARENSGYILTWEDAGETRMSFEGGKLVMHNEGMLLAYRRTMDAMTAAERARIEAAERVLDLFLGNWDCEIACCAHGAEPPEKRRSGTCTCARALGGRFVQVDGEDADGNGMLGFCQYDRRLECYRMWLFDSASGGLDAPYGGTWNEAELTFDWTVTGSVGNTLTARHHFVSDDEIECIFSVEGADGEGALCTKYILTRMEEGRRPLRAAASSAPEPAQPPEQQVLDQLLGTWSQERISYPAKWTPDETHVTGTFTLTRTLNGRFVRETGVDSEEHGYFNLFTYNEDLERYRFWTFASYYDGPEVPSTGSYNEAERTLGFRFSLSNGHTAVNRIRFLDSGSILSDFIMKDAADEILLNMEFKMARIKETAE